MPKKEKKSAEKKSKDIITKHSFDFLKTYINNCGSNI